MDAIKPSTYSLNPQSKSSDRYWQENEQTQQFEKTWETRKAQQDKQLDRIGQTVDTLGELARGMGEALDRSEGL